MASRPKVEFAPTPKGRRLVHSRTLPASVVTLGIATSLVLASNSSVDKLS